MNPDDVTGMASELKDKIEEAKDIVKKNVKSIQDLNWAWQFWNEEHSIWEQFQCPECLNLEFYYQAYAITGNEKFKFTKIVQGKVDFENFELTTNGSDNSDVKIRRTPDNSRKRPNSHRRHDPFK